MRALPARPQHGMRLPPVLVIVGLTQLACCAFGRAVRSFPIVYGFSARRAEKPYTEGRTYHAAAGNKRGVVTPKNASAEVLNRTALVARAAGGRAYRSRPPRSAPTLRIKAAAFGIPGQCSGRG